MFGIKDACTLLGKTSIVELGEPIDVCVYRLQSGAGIKPSFCVQIEHKRHKIFLTRGSARELAVLLQEAVVEVDRLYVDG